MSFRMVETGRTRLWQLRAFALSGAAQAGAQLLLNLYFGDAFHVGVGVGALAGCLCYHLAIPRVPRSIQVALSHLFNLSCLLLIAKVLPRGAHSAVFFVPYCLVTGAIATRVTHAVALISVAGLLLAVGSGPVPMNTPSWLAFGTATLVSFYQVYLLLRDDLREQRGSALELAATESALEREATAIGDRREALAAIRDELASASAQLTAELSAETAVTARLRHRRSEERELVQAMHHDMREPLRSIVSFNQLIARRLRVRGLSARGTQYLDFVADAGQRMARMLDDLLAYSTKGPATERVPVDLAAVFAEVRANLADRLRRTGATLTVAADLPQVSGFPTPLLQLFQNLVANALKFSRPGVPPVVEVLALAKSRGGVQVVIRDNGVGIAPEKLDAVFGLFDRGDADGGSEGSGVGLALCRSIAARHGGTLSVASISGEGSAFTLSLPAGAVVAEDPAEKNVPERDTRIDAPTAPTAPTAAA